MASIWSQSRENLRGPRMVLLSYGVLVLLPAAVFGLLLWDELRGDHERALQEAPREVRDAASRLETEAKRRLHRLLSDERHRSILHYADQLLVPQDDGQRPELISPLRGEPRPPGVAGWFQFDSAEGFGADLQLFFGSEGPGDITPVEDLRHWLQREVVDYANSRDSTHERVLARFMEEGGEDLFFESHTRVAEDLASVAYFTHQGSRAFCDPEEVRDYTDQLLGTTHRVLQATKLHLVPGPDGRPTLLLLRDVMIRRLTDVRRLRNLPLCLDAMNANQHWVQGFWVDPEWLLRAMPGDVGRSVLADRQLLFPSGAPTEPAGAWVQAGFGLIDGLEFERDMPTPEFDSMTVAVNVSELSDRYHTQTLWFAGLATIMLISGVLGLRLLLSRIRLSAENARRSENFVAAVTHELRTPISVVKLYGEMLRDDWVQDHQKRQDYAGRIVDESNRLSLLVDRVLEKRRLQGTVSRLAPGDLNEEIRSQAEILGLPDADDVRIDLTPDLSPALFTPEGVHTVLSNLVENARKYAPVTPEQPEPILVRTLPGKRGRIWLEVADRGKGIPANERERVLDAFYRIGDEATRSQPGTGLGLNLCAQSMRSQRGNLRILDRPGGGTIFRAIFRRA